MVYNKQVCQKRLGQFGEKMPLNRQSQTLVSRLKKKVMPFKHRHVGCPYRGNGRQYWRSVLRFLFGSTYLDIKLQRPNLKVSFDIRLSGALSLDTLNQIKILAQSAKIAGPCLWIDTLHAYVWKTSIFLFGRWLTNI